MAETKNETDKQPLTVFDAFKSLADKADGMERGCKHAFVERMVEKLWKTRFWARHRYNDMQRWNSADVTDMVEGAVADDDVDFMDTGILFTAYDIIALQELGRFMALESYDDGMFTPDDFKRAYSLNRCDYNSAMYAWRWLDKNYSASMVPMTVPLLMAEEHSLRICEALVQDVIQGYSFERHSSAEMRHAALPFEGRIGLVGVDALGKASVDLAESGYPIEFVKETALMASDDNSIPNTHDDRAAQDEWSKEIDGLRQDYVDSLNHRAMYVAGHIRQVDHGRIGRAVIMQPYADDKTVEAWFNKTKSKANSRKPIQPKTAGNGSLTGWGNECDDPFEFPL